MPLLASGGSPTVGDVATAAGVAAGTVETHFPNLDRLLLDATLGLMAAADTGPPLGHVEGDSAEDRAGALALQVQTMSPDLEALGRRLMVLTVEAEEPAPGATRRGHRRIGWIEEALAPARGPLDDAAFDHLVSAVAMVIGFEALLVQRDVRGLDRATAAGVSAWAARALVRAALEEAA